MKVINASPIMNAEDKTLTVGDTFDTMEGVSATDKEDGDLTDTIVKWLCLLDSMALSNGLGGSIYWTEWLSLLGILTHICTFKKMTVCTTHFTVIFIISTTH